MVNFVGRFNGVSKEDKEFSVLSFTYNKKGYEGLAAESCVMSPEYADKLVKAQEEGKEVLRGWDRKENKPFLFIKK